MRYLEWISILFAVALIFIYTLSPIQTSPLLSTLGETFRSIEYSICIWGGFACSIPMILDILQDYVADTTSSIFHRHVRLMNALGLFINSLGLILLSHCPVSMAMIGLLFTYFHLLVILYCSWKWLQALQPLYWNETRGVISISLFSIYLILNITTFDTEVKLVSLSILRDITLVAFFVINGLFMGQYLRNLFSSYFLSKGSLFLWLRTIKFEEISTVLISLTLLCPLMLIFSLPYVLWTPHNDDSFDPWNPFASSNTSVQIGIQIIKASINVIFYVILGKISRDHAFELKQQLLTQKSFIALISHEIRTPMSIISVGLELMESLLHIDDKV